MPDPIEKLSQLIETGKQIFILTGAGVSTGCGIPDFRGPNGIYRIVEEKYRLPYPEAIFEIDYFRKNPKPFFDFSKELFLNTPQPSLTHRFIARLEQLGKLNLLVTQNIDMLHETAGNQHIIACHGSYQTAHCLNCGKTYKIPEYQKNLEQGEIIRCCCNGIVKPDIVFFGESLPQSFLDFFSDPSATDLILVIGTSLTVQPASHLPFAVHSRYPTAPMVLINRTETSYDDEFDLVIREDSDRVFSMINQKLKLL